METNFFQNRGTINLPAILTIIKIESKVFLKTISLLFSQVAMPIIYFIFIVLSLAKTIGLVKFHNLNVGYQEYAFVGILAINITSQMVRVIYRMTMDRRYGFFALKLQSGVKPLFYVLSMSVSAVLGYLLQVATFFVLLLVFQLRIKVCDFFAAALMGMIGLYFWISLGTMVTMYIDSYQTRDLVISFLLAPLSFTAPTFFVLKDAPAFIQNIARVNPLTYQLEAMRLAACGTVQGKMHLLILLLSICALALATQSVAHAKLRASTEI